jgi:hypothetical protein
VLKRIRPIPEENLIFLDDQFVFWQKHSTLNYWEIQWSLEKNRRCSAEVCIWQWFHILRQFWIIKNQKNSSQCILQNSRIISNG